MIFNMLSPNLHEVYQNAIASLQKQRELVQVRQTIELLSIITISNTGQFQFMTQPARRLLNKYFQDSSLDINCLPENLQTWINNQINFLFQPYENPPHSLLLCVKQETEKLMIRMIIDGQSEEYVLLLEEIKFRSLSVVAIESLGLTKREAEVMFLVVQGSNNQEIAQVLSCSDRTIKKHLENIYKKLDVRTRVNAVTHVLNKLGLLNMY
jgi:DNA-binding CsgD family transcriptional regulator